MKKFTWRRYRKIILEAIFSHLRRLFSKFPYKILALLYLISLAQKHSHCLSANHNSELRCVICTGVTLFALALHLNCTALSQSVINFFIMYVINPLTPVPTVTARHVCSTSAVGKYLSKNAQIRVIGLMEPELCTKLLKKMSEKLNAKFPAPTPSCPTVKIGHLDDSLLEVFFNCKQTQ